MKSAVRISGRKTPLLDPAELISFVKGCLKRREIFLRACRRHGSPLYLIEKPVLLARAKQFTAAFRAVFPDVRVYFAIKSNNHPAVARTFVEAGLGLDVSSGRELQLALDCGAEDIVFSGPGKTMDELTLAVESRDRVTLLIDSFGELERLDSVASKAKAFVRAGVRLTTNEQALWAKFGIPLANLPEFWAAAANSRKVRLRGLQFHTSWNLDPGNYVKFIRRLGQTLKKVDEAARTDIDFIDIGGGFWPEEGEWLQRADGAPVNHDSEPRKVLNHFQKPANPIEEFADRIGQSIRREILPLVDCHICAEPGRWLSHDAMHLLLTVVDKKKSSLAITDAGTNAVGWERFETDYFPVINLSQPGLREHRCHILGSLCTPHDVWGLQLPRKRHPNRGHPLDSQPGGIYL
ncbi:MAG: hypothetical protein RAO92_01330 [Candidatus Euphemobacter frigidus]|nr:hypothetical protein [Candidatus Euphemobacter frigidus]MDP8275022.1 hypothetical protein [Candidatus Euphemobacter frigidus]